MYFFQSNWTAFGTLIKHTWWTIRDVWIRNRQVNRQKRETLFVHLFPHDKRVHFYVLYIRELWHNFVTYIVINSLYIVCNQVNFCYKWTGCKKGFHEPRLFACLLSNKISLDAHHDNVRLTLFLWSCCHGICMQAQENLFEHVWYLMHNLCNFFLAWTASVAFLSAFIGPLLYVIHHEY